MIRHVCIVLILLTGLVLFVKDYLPSAPYIYDEADYMYITTQGWLANYLDSPSQPILDFFHSGLSRGKDLSQRRALSEQIRSSGDVNFYRHWHGPLYFYWLSASSAWSRDEHTVRAASLVIPAITLFVIYFGVLWLVSAPARQWAAILCAALYIWSYSTLRTLELAPHQLYASCYIATLILIGKVMQTGDRRIWYGAVIGCALAFCTLEISFTLIATTLICGFVERRRLQITWRFALNSVALFVGSVFVLWPAAILKLTFLKSYVFMAYLALVRKSPWGQITFAQTWMQRFRESPLEWLLILAGLALFFRYRQRVLFPFVIYCTFAIVAVLRVNTDSPRYLLIFLPALLMTAGLSIGFLVGRFRPGAATICVTVLCLLTAWNTHLQFEHHPVFRDPREWEVLAFIRDRGLENKELSVPQFDLLTLHYYFPQTKLHGYVDASERASTGPVDAILYESYPVRFVLSPH
jgi:hypothetical protein